MTRLKLVSALTALAIFLTALAAPGRAASRQPAAWSAAARTAVFTIGSKTYTVDGRVYRMDAAPVLAGGSALVPLRYLAYSLGVPAGGIAYQSLEHLRPGLAAVNIRRPRAGGSPLEVTVLFSPSDPSVDRYAPHGLTGGLELQFTENPRVSPSGRLLVPCRDLAQALGALVAWNQAARQVTFKTWKTLPAGAPKLAVGQVSMYPGEDTITAIYGGVPVGRKTYPFPVEIPNPYYPGPGQNPDLYAVIPTLEAFGVPARNILWNPQSQTLAVAGGSSFHFLYFTVGANLDDNLTDELAVDLDPPDTGPSVSMVHNDILYADNTLILILAYGFNLQLTDGQGNNIDPILNHGGTLSV